MRESADARLSGRLSVDPGGRGYGMIAISSRYKRYATSVDTNGHPSGGCCIALNTAKLV